MLLTIEVLRRWDVYRPAKVSAARTQGGYQKICSGDTLPGGFVMHCPNRYPRIWLWLADNPSSYCYSRGGLFVFALSFIVGITRSAGHGQNRAESINRPGIQWCPMTLGDDRFT